MPETPNPQPEPADQDTPSPSPARREPQEGRGIDSLAKRFTAWLTGVIDGPLSSLIDPPERTSDGDDADTGPKDWDPDMPYRPDSTALYMLLQGVVLIRRMEDPANLHYELAAWPQSGYHRDETYTPGMSLILDLTLDEETSDADAEAWFAQLDHWVSTETPLVLMGRDGDVVILVDPNDPDAWLPLPL